MRALRRPRVGLPTLKDGPGARAQRALIASGEEPKTQKTFPAHWNRPDVRGALYAMHGRVCAFCLSELPRGDRGDVEHFRPKSLYFWLAYSFDNYLLSCSVCNRRFKSDHFPLRSGADRIAYPTRAALPDEQRLFIDPVTDTVEDWLWLAHDELLRWEARPTLPQGSLERERVETTKRWFHWNEDPDLVQARTDAVDRALLAFEQGKWEEARRLSSRFVPHGGAVRSLFSSLGSGPLPTATEELAWLLDDLWNEWQWARRLGGPISEDRTDVLRWTFAVLWASPPPLADLDVGAWISNAGLRPEVEPLFRLLIQPEQGERFVDPE